MRLTVHVKLRAREDAVRLLGPGEYEVAVRARPVAGAANEAVIRALAAHLRVAPSRVVIVAGQRSRRKVVEVA